MENTTTQPSNIGYTKAKQKEKTITCWVPVDLHTAFKLLCVKKGISLKEGLRKLLVLAYNGKIDLD